MTFATSSKSYRILKYVILHALLRVMTRAAHKLKKAGKAETYESILYFITC